ncbi:RNA polymerase factor sigma-54 [Bacillaceae bacterium Marseille-Q3522]|nr:RNA polymerase factor sigma-54 [Bacillaceae bacterium Marseille-Q3522]
MNLKPGLWQQQTLKLTMTQELSQAITLLQYNTQELTEFLENKALENPLMQIETVNVKTMDPLADRVKKSKVKNNEDKQNWIEQIGRQTTSLQEYLQSQLQLDGYSDAIKRACFLFIDSLDENGYLCVDLEETRNKLAVEKKDLEDALQLIQALEPAGVGARNLQECLLLQVRRNSDAPPFTEMILEECFLAFADKKWKTISKLCNIALKEIQDVFDYVQTLNPRPAAFFREEQTAYIIPDITIKWDGSSFHVSVFDENLPSVQFNESFYRKFSNHEDKQVKRFLQEKQHDYFWIVKSLEQRKETMIKVSLKIVEKQQEFFIHGPSNLKPMTMKEIADELGIHESTVSRAVREKYAQTPYGTFELKSFFSSTIKTTSSEDASSQQVKKKMAELIVKENKKKPLSDQQISAALEKAAGIVVSRRTVAKYREQLGIASSSKRRRFD